MQPLRFGVKGSKTTEKITYSLIFLIVFSSKFEVSSTIENRSTSRELPCEVPEPADRKAES